MSRILIAPLMRNLGESHRLDKIANELSLQGHSVYIIGDIFYDWLFTNSNFEFINIESDKIIYNEINCEKMLDIRNDFNFINVRQIEEACLEEINILKDYDIDAIITGYRLTTVITSKVLDIPLIWILSGAVSKESIMENIDLVIRGRVFSEKGKKIIIEKALNTKLPVKNWNKFLKSIGRKEFESAFQLFEGDLNLVTDITSFYNFVDTNYKVVGPILMKDIKKIKPKKKLYGDKILLSFGSSVDTNWLNQFLSSLPIDQKYILALPKKNNCIIPSDLELEVSHFIDYNSISDEIRYSIVHGGQGTLYDMLFHNIPMIAIPFFIEQEINIRKFKKASLCMTIGKNELDNLGYMINRMNEKCTEIQNNCILFSKKFYLEAQCSIFLAVKYIEDYLNR